MKMLQTTLLLLLLQLTVVASYVFKEEEPTWVKESPKQLHSHSPAPRHGTDTGHARVSYRLASRRRNYNTFRHHGHTAGADPGAVIHGHLGTPLPVQLLPVGKTGTSFAPGTMECGESGNSTIDCGLQKVAESSGEQIAENISSPLQRTEDTTLRYELPPQTTRTYAPVMDISNFQPNNLVDPASFVNASDKKGVDNLVLDYNEYLSSGDTAFDVKYVFMEQTSGNDSSGYQNMAGDADVSEDESTSGSGSGDGSDDDDVHIHTLGFSENFWFVIGICFMSIVPVLFLNLCFIASKVKRNKIKPHTTTA